MNLHPPKNILVTGASGNVGREVINHLQGQTGDLIISASRNKETNCQNRYFDFYDSATWEAALQNIHSLFLLRPPKIAAVKKYFDPLVAQCKKLKVKHIVFLSVQGAESISFIPHSKIEKLIRRSSIPYTFIRPSYFMENLTTTLYQDINEKREIFLPAGKAKFLWVSVKDIGKAAARILLNPKEHQNKCYTITGTDLTSFKHIAELLSQRLNHQINYISPNLPSFFLRKKKEGFPTNYILVLIILHFLPRFQKDPALSGDFKILTGTNPITLKTFIETEFNGIPSTSPII